MTARQLRRAAERKTNKLARKQQAALGNLVHLNGGADDLVVCETPTAPIELTPARLAANQANAQLSTGPTTPEGKAIFSQNTSVTASNRKSRLRNPTRLGFVP